MATRQIVLDIPEKVLLADVFRPGRFCKPAESCCSPGAVGAMASTNGKRMKAEAGFASCARLSA